MNKYQGLIAANSAIVRKQITYAVEQIPEFQVIGRARNHKDTLEKILRLQPHFVLLHMNMSIFSSVDEVKQLVSSKMIPIVLLVESDEMLKAYKHLGAWDIISIHQLAQYDFRALLKTLQQELKQLGDYAETVISPVIQSQSIKCMEELVVIGCSTGGPSALQVILRAIPASFSVPIVIIQHMPIGFTKSLADRFNQLCLFEVKEVTDGEHLMGGHVYIAPAGSQLLLHTMSKGGYRAVLDSENIYESLYTPSVDITLLSVAKHAKQRLTTVILTGMGNDGLQGCREVKKYGGSIYVESEETCVVYGMPKAVANEGLADGILPLASLANYLAEQLDTNKQTKS